MSLKSELSENHRLKLKEVEPICDEIYKFLEPVFRKMNEKHPHYKKLIITVKVRYEVRSIHIVGTNPTAHMRDNELEHYVGDMKRSDFLLKENYSIADILTATETIFEEKYGIKAEWVDNEKCRFNATFVCNEFFRFTLVLNG